MRSGVVWILGLIVVAGAAWYFIAHQGAAMPSGTASSTEMATSSDSNQAFSGSSSLSDIVARGGSWQCTFSTTGPTADSSGTVYISGKQVRGDFSSTVKQVSMTVESHMISDGTYAYSWSSSMPQGFKAKVTAQGQGGSATSGSQSFDMGAAYNYNCQPWTVDSSKFTLPSSVTFTAVN